MLGCVPQAEPGRYVVYLGNACPWCHRVLLTLILRGLLPGVMVVNAADDPERASRGGWVFDSPDPVFGAADLRRALRCCNAWAAAANKHIWVLPFARSWPFEAYMCASSSPGRCFACSRAMADGRTEPRRAHASLDV